MLFIGFAFILCCTFFCYCHCLLIVAVLLWPFFSDSLLVRFFVPSGFPCLYRALGLVFFMQSLCICACIQHLPLRSCSRLPFTRFLYFSFCFRFAFVFLISAFNFRFLLFSSLSLFAVHTDAIHAY